MARAVQPVARRGPRVNVDGFERERKDAGPGRDPARARRFWRAALAVADRLGASIEGLEHLPEGRALLVANHAFGWDIALAMALIYQRTGRAPWALGDHVWWRVPFLRGLAASAGVVDGTPENVDWLLSRDELVVVLPGGMREALKPRELRYRLLWGRRYGFVRAAIRNGAPLVPLAALGADEWVDWVGDPYQRGRRWFGRFGLRVPVPRPWAGLPRVHLVRPSYCLGEPVVPRVGPESADDPVALRRLRREVEGALYELIDEALARRAGF